MAHGPSAGEEAGGSRQVEGWHQGTEGDLAPPGREESTDTLRDGIFGSEPRLPALLTSPCQFWQPRMAVAEAPRGLCGDSALLVSKGSPAFASDSFFASLWPKASLFSFPKPQFPCLETGIPLLEGLSENLQVSSRPHPQQVNKKRGPLLLGRIRLVFTWAQTSFTGASLTRTTLFSQGEPLGLLSPSGGQERTLHAAQGTREDGVTTGRGAESTAPTAWRCHGDEPQPPAGSEPPAPSFVTCRLGQDRQGCGRAVTVGGGPGGKWIRDCSQQREPGQEAGGGDHSEGSLACSPRSSVVRFTAAPLHAPSPRTRACTCPTRPRAETRFHKHLSRSTSLAETLSAPVPRGWPYGELRPQQEPRGHGDPSLGCPGLGGSRDLSPVQSCPF